MASAGVLISSRPSVRSCCFRRSGAASSRFESSTCDDPRPIVPRHRSLSVFEVADSTPSLRYSAAAFAAAQGCTMPFAAKTGADTPEIGAIALKLRNFEYSGTCCRTQSVRAEKKQLEGGHKGWQDSAEPEDCCFVKRSCNVPRIALQRRICPVGLQVSNCTAACDVSGAEHGCCCTGRTRGARIPRSAIGTY